MRCVCGGRLLPIKEDEKVVRYDCIECDASYPVRQRPAKSST